MKATILTGWQIILINTNINNTRFSESVKTAAEREKGMHGSVGTQNEKLIHSTLKNYYAPYSDEQEVKIGNYFADAVNEHGIFEIQTRQLYRLKEKLNVFIMYTRVNVVYPVIRETSVLFINEDSGEVIKRTPVRKIRSELKIFDELYSIRDFLNNDNLNVILACLKTEKHVYFHGEEPPDLRNRSVKRKCRIENIPLALLSEIYLENPRDYEIFVPKDIPPAFSKKQLSETAKESPFSKRCEILKEVGLIQKAGKRGNAFIYKCSCKNLST